MNEHAVKVLDAYLDADTQSVPHAVLIEGRWGSGKTFFLQNVYEPARMREMNAKGLHHTPFLFVSLFGATSAADVEMRIYKAACPGEAIAAGIAGTIALGVGEFFRVKDATKGAMDKLGKKAIKRLNDFVFVFDDLERMEKTAFGEVMGLVNSLVAEHGRRVLLVTDETKLEELVGGDMWKDQNEKIVGRRAHIEADYESVIHSTIGNMPNGSAKSFMGARIDDLLEIAMASEIQNLRNLTWAMHNASAFVDCLIGDGEIPERHVASTMGVVLATTLGMRGGLLNAETLERLPGLATTLAFRSVGNNHAPLDPQLLQAKTFSDKFGSLSLDTPPIDYGFINGFERSGVMDPLQVNSWIKTQFGFGKEHAEPSWRRLWLSHERPMKDTDEAVAILAGELAKRVHTDNGPILHSAGLAIRQWGMNDQRLTAGEDVVAYFEKYIDEVAAAGLLEAMKFDHFPAGFDSHGGLGFSSTETGEFQHIATYLRAKSLEKAAAKRHERAVSIFAEAEAGDFEALFKFIRTDDPELSQTPVLLDIPVDHVAEFMSRDVPELSAGSKLLAYRYHRTMPGDPVLEELQWARDVYAAVVGKLAQWPEPHRPMALHSMNSLIRYYERDKQPEDRIIPPPKEAEAETEMQDA
ncbi:P-loop NTPase fold protein [Rhizobium laguerreae]|uniref:P-loop NTPase fold protein n=1 Tax=Rhizobium laguerreae TaxID=1076926 RepID=UPI001C905DE9|nr:P-loop NTPase fold protein [Rhizobium laguerreae]MBY3171875.1 hypothetical protein [Rhizobium laguerreae]MBY3344284.1 hypothetical protein [Rhizobium laguerreae]MBY3351318.1 hypothetical protein [Rhizobium laguerreae]MBY3376039.1 hypothetical protein [Rhizobium laguerreae]MBY3427159.1 hypothetical protein [Rhizobium laguerreae]